MSDLSELEKELRGLSHSTDALQILQTFSAGFKNTKQRQYVFNASGALLIVPSIDYTDAVERKLISDNEEDEFVLLQGDLIATDAAFFLGDRLTNMRFLVANSTCDLVPDRRDYAVLLPIRPIRRGETDAERKETKQLLAQLLSFKSTRRMYLPSFQDDDDDIVANTVEFDRLAQVRMVDLLIASRIASLSLVGWRIFGSHLRDILTRAGDGKSRLETGGSSSGHWKAAAGSAS